MLAALGCLFFPVRSRERGNTLQGRYKGLAWIRGQRDLAEGLERQVAEGCWQGLSAERQPEEPTATAPGPPHACRQMLNTACKQFVRPVSNV